MHWIARCTFAPAFHAQVRCFSPSAASSVVLSVDDKSHVATITLNRPEQMNAMTVSMGQSFQSIIADLKQRDDVRAVVLTGAGRAFSAGGDLDFLQARAKEKPHINSEEMQRFYQRFLVVRQLPVPVIAAINGAAVGAGLCVAMACDIRLCASSAKLGLTFVQLGIHPGMGATFFLPQIVGPQAAAKLLLTGELVNAADAKAIGLVAEVVEEGEGSQHILRRAHELAASIAANSPVAVREITHTLRRAQEEGVTHALGREADAQALCYASNEYSEALAAVAKRVKK